MRKGFLMAGAMAMMCLFAPKAQAQGYELRVLTFEDADLGESFSGLIETPTGTESPVVPAAWSDMIDNPQYGGSMYSDYGTTGMMYWHDGGLTELYHTCVLPYWSGGHAISHYGSNDLSTYGNYDMQLTVYKADESGLTTTGAGHNGSDQFAIHFGYNAASYSYGTDSRQTLEFADGVERVIDHMYVNNTTYLLNQYLNGGGFNPAATTDDWFRIKATGYDASDNETTTIYFYLCQGNELGNGVIDDWTRWDMDELGEVVRVVFDMEASENMTGTYGMNPPAYFAYDDVAVRFPVSAPTSYERTGLTVGNYGTICLPYAVSAGAYTGATFYTTAGQTSEGIILEEVDNLAAGKAYIFRATATTLNCTYSGDAVATPVSASLNNGLQGTFEDNTEIPSGMYFLHNNLLYQSEGSNHVNANRAYIDITYVPAGVPTPVAGRRQIVIPCVPSEATGIDAMEADGQKGTKTMVNGVLMINRNGRTFNAQGQEVK